MPAIEQSKWKQDTNSEHRAGNGVSHRADPSGDTCGETGIEPYTIRHNDGDSKRCKPREQRDIDGVQAVLKKSCIHRLIKIGDHHLCQNCGRNHKSNQNREEAEKGAAPRFPPFQIVNIKISIPAGTALMDMDLIPAPSLQQNQEEDENK